VLYEYGQIGILVIVALIFPLGAIVTSWALRYARVRPWVASDPVKEDIYECGLRTEGTSHPQFNFRFYYIALSFGSSTWTSSSCFPGDGIPGPGWDAYFGLGFIAILVVGIVYAWRKRRWSGACDARVDWREAAAAAERLVADRLRRQPRRPAT
jgi:NADH:ubiquinone oxidoreductase subunit 3 (subunit A)